MWFAIAVLAAIPASAWARREAGSFVAQTPTSVARNGATMSELQTGNCLLAGDGTSELFNASTRTWAGTGNMNAVRRHHSATLLNDGRIFVAGGNNGSTVHSSTEIYDPATGVWTPGPNMSSPRNFHTANLWESGTVLLAGGTTTTNSTTATNTAEIYDPVSNTITPIAPFTSKRSHHHAVWWGAKLMVFGGLSENGIPLASAEMYDPIAAVWSPAASMTQARWGFGAVVTFYDDVNDTIYAVGGHPDPHHVEQYLFGSWWPVARTNDPHVFPAVGGIGISNDVLVFGSVGDPKNSAEIYNPYKDRWGRSAYGVAPFLTETSRDSMCWVGPNERLIAPAPGSTVVQQYALSVPVASNDFSGDSRSDIAFVSGPNSSRWVFKMNGASVGSSAPLPAAAPGWWLAALGDFDNNGSTDMFWSNFSGPSLNWIYLMQDGMVTGGGAVTASAWYQNFNRITHVADFNGDGKPDILWEVADLSPRMIDLMNGVNPIGVLQVPPAQPGWEIAGAGNFDGLHGADLLWMNYTNPGEYWVYLLDTAANVIGGGPVFVAPGYLPTHIGDANRDGKADIVWENGTSSRWVYTMNGAQLLGTFALPPAAPGWVLVGSGDFDNAQGGLDWLWQNTAAPTQYWVTLTDTAGAVIGGGGVHVAPGYTPLPTSGAVSLGGP
jgi:hypothetical protein